MFINILWKCLKLCILWIMYFYGKCLYQTNVKLIYFVRLSTKTLSYCGLFKVFIVFYYINKVFK